MTFLCANCDLDPRISVAAGYSTGSLEVSPWALDWRNASLQLGRDPRKTSFVATQAWARAAAHPTELTLTDPAVRGWRERQLRHLLCSLLLAPGVRMLLMGHGVRRSQGGNNNTWGQKNLLGWIHWRHEDTDPLLRLFVRRLISLRLQLVSLLNPDVPLAEAPPRCSGDGRAAVAGMAWGGAAEA